MDRYTAQGEETRINPEVGCSNGIGWTNDGKTMCKLVPTLYTHRIRTLSQGGIRSLLPPISFILTRQTT